MSVIACNPPLGGITVIDNGCPVLFSVVIDTDAIEGDLDVYLWHETDGGSWTDLPLPHMSTSDSASENRLARFQGTLHCDGTSSKQVHFTLKIVVGHKTVWSNDLDPSSDGLLIFQSSALLETVGDLLDSVDERWRVDQSEEQNSSHGKAWVFRSLVSGRDTDHSAWEDFSIGKAAKVLNWFALVRHSSPWLGPRQGDKDVQLDKPGLLLAFLREDGTHMVILPVNGVPGLLVTLENDHSGKIVARTRNDTPSPIEAQVIVAVDRDLEAALASAIEIAKSILSHNADDFVDKIPDRADLTDWYDGFSYCTWNGIGRELNEETILEALTGLQEQGIRVSNLIVDDNWQSLEAGDSSDVFEYQWSDFEANKENFPQGLSHLTKRVRETHPSIRHIAVWHGLFGYWGGMAPEGRIAKSYESVTVERQQLEPYMNGGKVTTTSGAEVARMYDDFYSFLIKSGVDSVKADNQHYPDYVAGAGDREAIIQSYQNGWLAASAKHFQHRAISCMSQTPQILFHSFLNQKNLPPYLVRNSDDFWPDIPTSHTWHLFCNAHNSILTQFLNILPDWDMFQTAGPFPGMHAAARCLSGGPIYITDVPGQHDKSLIDQMTANTVDGVLHILRPETLGRSLNGYNSPESPHFLRIGSAHKGSSILGIFNIGQRKRMEIVAGTAFKPRLPEHESYIVRSHVADEVFVHRRDDFITVTLAPKEYEILTAIPIETEASFRFTILGLLGKMTGIAALLEKPVSRIDEDGSLSLALILKTVGLLGLWFEDAEQYTRKDLFHARFRVGDQARDLPVTSRPNNIVVVDLETVAADGENHNLSRTFEMEINVQPL